MEYETWTRLFAMRKLRSRETQIVVADDGSTYETINLCHRRHVPVLTGENLGSAGDENRALACDCTTIRAAPANGAR